ncbi:MAG: hypothetical protein LBD45_08550 [Bacteroidales bacterium]|jgi:hypothetical protein|nr:hypothetical protein [Bacteroidales bacterium]
MPNHFHGILEITGNTDNNYVLKNDDTTHDDAVTHDVGAGRALPNITPKTTPKTTHDTYNTAINVGAGRALPLHATLQHSTEKPRTTELPQSRFQNIGKNTMSSIIGGFKSAVTRNIRTAGYDFAWQRNLWEHVVRDAAEYARINDYITNNPLRWKDDMFYKE